VPVAIALAAVAILGGIVVVAMGKGGELSRERPELPARTDFRSWRDVADYRPPPALLGYHAVATQRALALIARTIAERDAEIDWLRKRLAEFQPERPGGAADAGDPAVDESAAEAALPAHDELFRADDVVLPAGESMRLADEAVLTAGEAVLPPAVNWQAGGAAPGVAAGYAAQLPGSRSLSEDE
jgi:hypothetical protein